LNDLQPSDHLGAKKQGLDILSKGFAEQSLIASGIVEQLELIKQLAEGTLHTNKQIGNNITKKVDVALDTLNNLIGSANKLKSTTSAMINSHAFIDVAAIQAGGARTARAGGTLGQKLQEGWESTSDIRQN